MKRFYGIFVILAFLSFIDPQYGYTGTGDGGYGTWLEAIPTGERSIYGGQGQAQGSGNVVLFQNVQLETFKGNRGIYGGYVLGANTFSKENMIVLDHLGVTGEIVGGLVDSSEGDAMAQYNDVFLSGNSFAMQGIIGADASLQGEGRAIASNSRIIISGSTVHESAIDQKTAIFGGRALLFDYSTGVSYGQYAYATSDNNFIDIFDGSKIMGDVVGGYVSLNQNVDAGNWSSASDNTIMVENSSITKEGSKIVGGQLAGETGYGTAQFNTVSLSGVDFALGTELYGGLVGEEWTTGVNQNLMVFHGNTLNFGKSNLPWSNDIKFKRIANFEVFNFMIPSNLAKDAVIVQTENLVLGNGIGSPSYVNSIQYSGRTSPGLAVGDYITLIKSDNMVIDPVGRSVFGTGYEAFKSTDVTVKWGSLFEQEFTTAVTTNAIVAQVKGNREEIVPATLSNSNVYKVSSADQPPPPKRGEDIYWTGNHPPTVANLATIQASGEKAEDYKIGVKLASDINDSGIVRRHNWKNLTASERTERKVARREAWAAMSEDERNMIREKRKAYIGNRPRRGALFE
jgi:hypothetical protein